MIRKDYVQRYFDELAKVIATTLTLKNDLKPIEAERKLNDFSTDYLGLSFEEILNVSGKDIIDYLIKRKEFTITHFKLLENLLYHKLLLNPKNKNLKSITLEILSYTSKNDKDYSLERMERLDEILNQ